MGTPIKGPTVVWAEAVQTQQDEVMHHACTPSRGGCGVCEVLRLTQKKRHAFWSGRLYVHHMRCENRTHCNNLSG